MVGTGFQNSICLDWNGGLSQYFLAGSSHRYAGGDFSGPFWNCKSFWSKKNRYVSGIHGLCPALDFIGFHWKRYSGNKFSTF